MLTRFVLLPFLVSVISRECIPSRRCRSSIVMSRNVDHATFKSVMASFVITAALVSPLSTFPVHADQRLNAATAAGTRVNSDPESLLRYGLPITNKEVRGIQTAVETIRSDLLSRRLAFAKLDLQNLKNLLSKNGDGILKAMPGNHAEAAAASLTRLREKVSPLETTISSAAEKGTGSQQERDLFDAAFYAQDELAKELSVFEQLLVPDSYKRDIPDEYRSLPALQGRAEVEMTIVRPGGEKFDVDGKLYDEVNLKLVIDGYNAPITGGNFVDLVKKGYYNNKVITRSDGFVVQTGDADPTGTVHGYVPPDSKSERTVPLEIAFKNDQELLYGMTSEDDGRGAVAAVLPFQAFGAIGMARSEYEPNSASSQFFWLLFDSDLTPAGKNMLDGRYTCFGYTVKNADLLKDVKEGDIIKVAKVTKGGESL